MTSMTSQATKLALILVLGFMSATAQAAPPTTAVTSTAQAAASAGEVVGVDGGGAT